MHICTCIYVPSSAVIYTQKWPIYVESLFFWDDGSFRCVMCLTIHMYSVLRRQRGDVRLILSRTTYYPAPSTHNSNLFMNLFPTLWQRGCHANVRWSQFRPYLIEDFLIPSLHIQYTYIHTSPGFFVIEQNGTTSSRNPSLLKVLH